MKNLRIEFAPRWFPTPLSYWVHKEADGRPWDQARIFEPPLPEPVPARGFPIYVIKIFNFEFRFASRDEIKHCIEVLAHQVLPTPQQLSKQRGGAAVPDHHWLCHFPSRLKAWKMRQAIIKELEQVLQEIGR